MSQYINLITGGAGGGTISASASSISLGQVVFSNSNNVSFGLSGSTVTGSIPSVTHGTISASASSISLGQVVFSNSNNVSFGLSGSTVTGSIPVFYLSQFPIGGAGALASDGSLNYYTGSTTTTAGGSATVLSVFVEPYPISNYLAFNRVWRLGGIGFGAGTYSNTLNALMGLYTATGNSISLLSTWNFGAVYSQNSATAVSVQWWWGTNSTSNSSGLSGNVSASFGAGQVIVLAEGVSSSISPGNYWLGMVASNVTNTGIVAYIAEGRPAALIIGKMYGESGFAAMDRFFGVLATTLTSNAASITNLLPAVINVTDVNSTLYNVYSSSAAGLHFANT